MRSSSPYHSQVATGRRAGSMSHAPPHDTLSRAYPSYGGNVSRTSAAHSGRVVSVEPPALPFRHVTEEHVDHRLIVQRQRVVEVLRDLATEAVQGPRHIAGIGQREQRQVRVRRVRLFDQAPRSDAGGDPDDAHTQRISQSGRDRIRPAARRAQHREVVEAQRVRHVKGVLPHGRETWRRLGGTPVPGPADGDQPDVMLLCAGGAERGLQAPRRRSGLIDHRNPRRTAALPRLDDSFVRKDDAVTLHANDDSPRLTRSQPVAARADGCELAGASAGVFSTRGGAA